MSLLLQKLDHYGVRGCVHTWITDFLSAGAQCVVLDSSSSALAPVTHGVPQSSVFGPLLFLAYINDKPSRVKSTVRIFSGDSLVYRTIHSDWKTADYYNRTLTGSRTGSANGRSLSIQRSVKSYTSPPNKILSTTHTPSIAKPFLQQILPNILV